MIEMAQWCSICNAAPSDGTLKIENPFDSQGEPVDIEACLKCVESLDWEGGKVKKENDHA
jgi:methylaspartate ammonia-lyase